jgi:hypothetical protein
MTSRINPARSDDDTKVIVLEDFHNPSNKWTTLNDPVMGGQSFSNVEIDIDKGIARFTGKCAIVPSLQAPGFITMETGSKLFDKPSKLPDVSSCAAFQFELKTNVEYSGYRFSFGKAHARGGRFAFGYKAPLLLDQERHPVGEFTTVTIPFDEFSDRWDDATGDIIIACKDDPSFCPTKKWLQKMESLSFWGEGVEGIVDLEIKSISAIGCANESSETAIAPSASNSKFHTISSNPFFLAVVSFMAILVCITATCFTHCCCNSKRSHKQRTKDPRSDVVNTYKDAPTTLHDFEDKFDVELPKN